MRVKHAISPAASRQLFESPRAAWMETDYRWCVAEHLIDDSIEARLTFVGGYFADVFRRLARRRRPRREPARAGRPLSLQWRLRVRRRR